MVISKTDIWDIAILQKHIRFAPPNQNLIMKFTYNFILLFLFSFYSFSQVGINTTSPDPSSILDISASNKGVLFPRVALTGINDNTTIANPSVSLLVYNTSSNGGLIPGYYFWSGSNWSTVTPTSNGGGGTGSSEAWSLTGNTGTDGGTINFLGTTDNKALVFKTNSIARTRITTKGQIEVLNTNGSVFLGEGAGAQTSVASASNNIFIGLNADYDAGGASHSIVLGNNSRTSSNYSISIGDNADADSSNSISIGRNTQSQGTFGIVIGDNANTNKTGTVAIGKSSQTQGNYAISIGESAYTNQENAIAIGKSSQAQGNSSISFGANAYSSGNNSIAIGKQAQAQADNAIAIGNNIYNGTANKIRLGNSSISVIEGQVAFSYPSDARFKYNVTEKIPGLDFINRLRPVQYNFDRAKYSQYTKQPDIAKNTNRMESGFLAQDVEKVARELNYDFDGLHTPQNDSDTYTLSYSTFVVPLVKAVQEQQSQIQQQQAEIDELKALVKQLLAEKK
ncbi:MAG: hypothetical protein COA40_07970 [Aequorivita sp.]|nr:MAG: hypothetical protein COA40_07970 [Aequorivita sp.]